MGVLYVIWHVPLVVLIGWLAVRLWQSRFRGRGLPLQGKWLKLFILTWVLLGVWSLLGLVWSGARTLGFF